MTPESVPDLRIAAADIAPIWRAIAGLGHGRLAVAGSPPQEPTKDVVPERVAA